MQLIDKHAHSKQAKRTPHGPHMKHVRSTRGSLAGLKFEKIAESLRHFGFRIYNVIVNLNSGDASFLIIAVADEVPQQKYLTEKTEAIWTTSFKRTAKIEATKRLIRQCAPVNVNPQVKCGIFPTEGPRMGQSFKCYILINCSVILESHPRRTCHGSNSSFLQL